MNTTTNTNTNTAINNNTTNNNTNTRVSFIQCSNSAPSSRILASTYVYVCMYIYIYIYISKHIQHIISFLQVAFVSHVSCLSVVCCQSLVAACWRTATRVSQRSPSGQSKRSPRDRVAEDAPATVTG